MIYKNLHTFMNIDEYLKRINFSETPINEITTFNKLHSCHVFSVPFENLDIQHQTAITLELDHLFKKVVGNYRGGFCYELNYLFQFLLIDLGFDVSIISARIFDGDELGPAFDHMALRVELDGKRWLADVGFGDLFIKPIEIEHGSCQFDGRNYFKVERRESESFLLSMSKDGVAFERKYVFQTKGVKIDAFSEECRSKQQSPSSYFVKNKVVTLPIPDGRKTIFNSKFIVKKNGHKTESTIENKKDEMRILAEEFNVKI